MTEKSLRPRCSGRLRMCCHGNSFAGISMVQRSRPPGALSGAFSQRGLDRLVRCFSCRPISTADCSRHCRSFPWREAGQSQVRPTSTNPKRDHRVRSGMCKCGRVNSDSNLPPRRGRTAPRTPEVPQSEHCPSPAGRLALPSTLTPPSHAEPRGPPASGSPVERAAASSGSPPSLPRPEPGRHTAAGTTGTAPAPPCLQNKRTQTGCTFQTCETFSGFFVSPFCISACSTRHNSTPLGFHYNQYHLIWVLVVIATCNLN